MYMVHRQEQPDPLVLVNVNIRTSQRDWIDEERLRRSEPGRMLTRADIIRSLIDFCRASDEYASVSEEGKL